MAEEIKAEISSSTSGEQKYSAEKNEEVNSLSSETSDEQKFQTRKIDSLENALRKFKRQSSGIISEVRKREAYDKPSVKRKKKSTAARRHKKNNRFNGNKW